MEKVKNAAGEVQTFTLKCTKELICLLSFAPAVNIKMTWVSSDMIMEHESDCVFSCSDEWSLPSVVFHACSFPSFVLTEQHIMETAVVSGVYVLQRRGHLQARPLPQPTV